MTCEMCQTKYAIINFRKCEECLFKDASPEIKYLMAMLTTAISRIDAVADIQTDIHNRLVDLEEGKAESHD